MSNDSTKPSAGKPHSTRSGSPELISIGGREGLERPIKIASKLGAGQGGTQGRDAGSAVAYLVPGGRGAEKPRVFLWEAAAAAVRVVGSADAPWFVAKDVCSALGHSNSRMALQRLDEDEKGVRIVYTLGGEQETAVISESGLFALILTSRLPSYRVFRKWVTSEVLPQIRKTGSYAVPAERLQRQLAAHTIEITHRPQLEEGASITEEHVVACLCRTLLGIKNEVIVRAGTLVDLAMRDGCFQGWFNHHHEGYLRTAGFMRRLVAYHNRPLEAGHKSDQRIHIRPHGENRHRRYIISRHYVDEQPVTTNTVHAEAALAIVAAALQTGGEVIVK